MSFRGKCNDEESVTASPITHMLKRTIGSCFIDYLFNNWLLDYKRKLVLYGEDETVRMPECRAKSCRLISLKSNHYTVSTLYFD